MKYAILAIAILATPAYASNSIDGQVELYANASAVCGPALPVYDTNIRRRPLALQNESTTGVPGFATCGFIVDKRAIGNQYGGTENFSIVSRNVYASGSRSITCTAVIGVDDGNAVYHAKTVTVAPGARATMTWASSDYGVGAGGFPGPVSMSCMLPAGTALNEWKIHWDTIDRIS